VDSNELVVIGILIVTAAAMWLIFLARTRTPKRPGAILGIPQALRPGQPDEALEGPRILKIQSWWIISILALAVFIPAYWLGELHRQEAFAQRFEEESLHRGYLIYQEAPPLPEDSDPKQFREAEEAIALGMGCARCHGPADAGQQSEDEYAAGGQVPFTEPSTGKDVNWVAPPLQTVYQRWDEEIIRFTIERGRPGTPMPTWGVEYGGPMTTQMVDDVMGWIASLPGNNQAPEGVSESCQNPSKQDFMKCGEEIFQARCAVCHGPEGQGKEAPAESGSLPIWYQGLALWKGDVSHLTKGLHLTTVRNGRRFAFMPPFAEAPTQGIPAPTYPLTDKQIQAVVTYERSL
jgi:cytochrome c553